MKKILLLFVLFLGLNVGAFAINEVEVDCSMAPDWTIIVDVDAGTVSILYDGNDCSDVVTWEGGQGSVETIC